MKHLALASACLAMIAGSAHALEHNVTIYPNGVETFGAGVMPGPGFYYLNNTTYYSASDANNASGHSSVPDFHVNVISNSFRFDEVWPVNVLGANVESRLILPFVYIDTHAAGRHEDRAGLADVTLAPVVLGWHAGNLHWTAGMDVSFPIDSYSKTDLVNVVENYVQFEPHLSATYMVPHGPEFDIKLMYDFNTTDNATRYHSGQAFHTDFAGGWNFGNLTIGVVGYYLAQTTNDTVNGNTVLPSGNRTMAFGVGPGLRYFWKGIRIQLNCKHEFVAVNHTQGNSIWLRLLIPL